MPVTKYLIPFWNRIFEFNWTFGLALILLFGIPRFILVLGANVSCSFNLVSIVFLSIWIAPFIFLTKRGRQEIGFRKSQNHYWLILSFLLGIALCGFTHLVGRLLFGDSVSNWFVYLSRPFEKIAPAFESGPSTRLTWFIISATIGITFSPIGEELFYRGLIHGSFATSLGERRASIVDSLAFAVTHLAHFGIVFTLGKWDFLILPSLLWMSLMFISSRIFFMCKVKTNSILGAIVSHAGFNLAMMYFIFYHFL